MLVSVSGYSSPSTEDHPDTLTSMANLASTYRHQGRWEAAEELEVQVMEMSKKKLGLDHPSTLLSFSRFSSWIDFLLAPHPLADPIGGIGIILR